MKENELLTQVDLGKELETVGEFIFDALKTFSQLDSFTRQYEVNYILFHASIGIERLQKILLFLACGGNENYKELEKEFRTYSHEKLHNKLLESYKVNFSNEELHFLIILSDYYREYRYSVYELPNTRSDVRLLLMQFFNIQLKLTIDPEKDYQKYKDEITGLFGRTLGSVIRTYYKAICDKANELGASCAVGRDTVAYLLFNKEIVSDNLMALIEKYTTAQKELIIYLKNTDGDSSFINYIENIEPLELDADTLNDCLSEVLTKNYSEKLTDGVDKMYAAMDGEKLRIRKELLALIGNKAYFDFMEALKDEKP